MLVLAGIIDKLGRAEVDEAACSEAIAPLRGDRDVG